MPSTSPFFLCARVNVKKVSMPLNNYLRSRVLISQTHLLVFCGPNLFILEVTVHVDNPIVANEEGIKEVNFLGDKMRYTFINHNCKLLAHTFKLRTKHQKNLFLLIFMLCVRATARSEFVCPKFAQLFIRSSSSCRVRFAVFSVYLQAPSISPITIKLIVT